MPVPPDLLTESARLLADGAKDISPSIVWGVCCGTLAIPAILAAIKLTGNVIASINEGKMINARIEAQGKTTSDAKKFMVATQYGDLTAQRTAEQGNIETAFNSAADDFDEEGFK